MNRFAAIIIFILAAPVALILAVLIRLDSAGPVIFRQVRVGQNKKEFMCLKFRTMQQDTPSVGSHLVSASSVTRVGKFMRASKLDELPQLVNIIQRDMNFIGFRPCLPNQEAVIQEREKRGVYDFMPGITGLAQIKKIDMSTPVEIAEADAEYYKRRGIGLNFSILLATALGSGSGDSIKRGT